MSRALLALGLVLLAVSGAQADLKPPMGQKSVTLDHKFTTEKEWPDYQFFTLVGGQGPRAKLTALKLDPKTPATLPGAERSPGIGRSGLLIAVPKDAEKNYKTEKEFHDALKGLKVEGLIRAKPNFDARTTIKDTDKRTVILYEHLIEKVDAKDGIVVTTKRDVEPKKEPDKKDSPEDDSDTLDDTPGVTAYTPRGGVWVAGLACFAAITLGGLWLAGRSKRKV